jgi:hypothetical protein
VVIGRVLRVLFHKFSIFGSYDKKSVTFACGRFTSTQIMPAYSGETSVSIRRQATAMINTTLYRVVVRTTYDLLIYGIAAIACKFTYGSTSVVTHAIHTS